MSSQTSNSRFQTAQQSRAACYNAPISPSHSPQCRTVTTTNNSGSPKRMGPRYFEEYGLHVPLFKFAQRRLHARSASELAGKSKKALSGIVKDITNGQTSKVKNASRSELARFIERVETLALGPNPKTTLPSTKIEDLIEALGLKITAQKAKCNETKKEAPRQKPAAKKASYPADNKVIAQALVSSAVQDNTPEQKSTPTKQATLPTSPPEQQTVPAPVRARKQISHHAPVKSAEAAQRTNKRNYDSADAPADTEQTPAKRMRFISATSAKAPRSPRMSATVVTGAQVIVNAPSAPLVTAEQATQDRTAAPTSPSPAPDRVSAPSPRIYGEQDKIALSPMKKRDSSSVTHVSNLDTVIALTQTPVDERADKSRKEELEKEPPFLKPGRHGRGVDFENDLDRKTGRGHQVDPKDLARKRAYDAHYWAFKKQYPHFPWLDEQKRCRVGKQMEELEQLRREEVWMRGYREKYPGEVVGHLWDCGCEMVMDGDESEEE